MPQKAKKFWEFRASKMKNSAELLLYGPISEESWWGDEVTPKQFADELKSLGDITELTVRINSGGGDVFAGQAIHSLLRSHQAKVTVYVDGLAASIASVIAMAGDTVVMPRNAMMMIHNPWTIGWGNANDFRRIADDLDKIRESIIAAYQEKSGIDRDKLIELLDAETWLTAEEALEYGLIDEIDERKTVAASMKGGMLVMNGLAFDITGFKNPPKIDATATSNGKEVNQQMELTVEILAKQYPDIYNAVKQEGYNDGVKAERERFKALQELEAPGCEEILNQARYETGETAEQVAIKIVNVLKSSGVNRLAAAIQDAAPVNQLDYQAGNQIDEKDKVISAMVRVVNQKRGVKQ
ncbi:head maturation protease, ClpP-related [Geobacillus stearothermophilus]|uniref:head maturation protease, ClpP-related n=1 Tax=Geobacillus stearothermophilus TaxID=1422 RepID=UPI002E1D2263|nr:head maturation protease, ClpP-related [Geobacillus stearothermophilus]MED3732544.1 Clp protease ClpP [Geobacillus stearothermophilus]MED3740124.1 Clp protease ClpP [Geobacillus stearothermophilus]MED3765979.1 Clp protease ClpP [Geobacillus stearothermophilus]MED3773720.1 Clp protease ClpP [Geobacillus stearothermophilus]